MSELENTSATVLERLEHHADAILRASGSALGYYSLPTVRKSILQACLDLHDEAWMSGAMTVSQVHEAQGDE